MREAFEKWLTDECLNVTYDDALYIWQAAHAAGMERAAEIVERDAWRLIAGYALRQRADAIRAEIKEPT